MSTLIWIELKDPDRARRLASMLESRGFQADVSHTLRGAPEVRIKKPRWRRMKPFVLRVAPIVRRWLSEQAPGTASVTARTLAGDFPIHAAGHAGGTYDAGDRPADTPARAQRR